MRSFQNPMLFKMYGFNHRRITCETKRCWLPRKCYLSGKKLWLKKCDVIAAMVITPEFPKYKTHWCDPQEFLLHELKR